jgi:hypothetical protein
MTTDHFAGGMVVKGKDGASSIRGRLLVVLQS